MIDGLTLEGFVGHAAVREQFARGLAAGAPLAPAQLFSGPPGVGKSTFARRLARAVLCQAAPGRGCRPASECASCRKASAGVHPDLRVLAPEPGKMFPVELADAFRREVVLVPWESAVRFFILEDVDRLSPEAGNSLLKVIEEPPDHARLILIVAHLGDLLPTIESRCARVRFGPLSVDEVAGELVRRGKPEAEARLVAGLSEGSLGRALAAGAGLEAVRAKVLEVWASGGSGRAGARLAELVETGELHERRDAARRGLDLLSSLHRDRLAERLAVPRLLFADLPPGLLDRLPADVESLLDRLDGLALLREAVDSNVDPRVVLEEAGRLVEPLAA